MEVANDKEVLFGKYCDICKNKNKMESESPCDDCLAEAYNINSHKPVYFEEKEN